MNNDRPSIIKIFGSRCADPEIIITTLSHHLNIGIGSEPLTEIDTATIISIPLGEVTLILKAVRPTVFYKEIAYKEHIKDADMAIYVFGHLKDCIPLVKDDYCGYDNTMKQKQPHDIPELFLFNHWHRPSARSKQIDLHEFKEIFSPRKEVFETYFWHPIGVDNRMESIGFMDKIKSILLTRLSKS